MSTVNDKRKWIHVDNVDVLLSSRASESTLSEVNDKLTQPTSLKSADVSVGTTAAAIFSESTPSRSAVLLADEGNTDTIYIGDSSAQKFPLKPGDSVRTDVSDLSAIYAYSPTDGQTLHVLWEV